jgi:hypothetical protein
MKSQVSASNTAAINQAREWIDLLEGPHFIVPPPVISRAQILDVSRAFMLAAEQAELWQRRYEWMRDHAILDNRWVDLADDAFLAKVDEHIAEDLK